MLYNSVAWPTWSMALAPDFTLFMPVTDEARDVYQGPVPPVPNRDEEQGNAAPQAAPATTTEFGDDDAEQLRPSQPMVVSTGSTPSPRLSSGSSDYAALPVSPRADRDDEGEGPVGGLFGQARNRASTRHRGSDAV